MFFDPNLVANIEYYELVSSICKCIICEGIINEPIKCSSCDNCFCKSCIDSWKTYSSICPFRCKTPKYSPSKYILRILSKLMFECEKKCMSILYYNDYLKHLTITCPNINSKETLSKMTTQISQIQLTNDILEKKYSLLKDKIARLDTNTSKKNDNTIISKHHFHPLVFDSLKTGWYCDICGKDYKNYMKSGCCSKCNYNLCLECFYKEFTSSVKN